MGQDSNQAKTFYLARSLIYLIYFIIRLKFYPDMVFSMNCYFLFYVTRCVSFVTRRVFFMTHCISFVTRRVTNFHSANKNWGNTIELILWKQRVHFMTCIFTERKLKWKTDVELNWTFLLLTFNSLNILLFPVDSRYECRQNYTYLFC